MGKLNAWITAARLRTLPLSISGVVMGTFMAISTHNFSWQILTLALLTTLFLQVLSNFANDYGDSKNGKDTKERQGPSRMVQSGLISLPEMKNMIIVFCLLSFVSGVLLIKTANINFTSISFLVLLSLGVLAIAAALTYTIGKNPYGYSGWGDISVFLFFGLFSVVGSYFLYAGEVRVSIFLPAIAIGCFSVGVLNINNLRDCNDDKRTGKITMVVKLGIEKAKLYHISLIIIAIILSLVYLIINRFGVLSYVFIIVIIPLVKHISNIAKANTPDMFDKELKKLALTTLAHSIIFGICINI
jgi:1,4-dihydroxy-2-naphthoate octaprenyltransferase